MPRAKIGMKYISRMQYEGQTSGWWVRIQRKVKKGEKPLVISQFFSDSHYGGKAAGKAKALHAAKLFRDSAVEKAPAPQQEVHQPPGVKNGYGYSRITFRTQRKRSVDPKTKKRIVVTIERRVVEGWYRDHHGKVSRKKVSIGRWGEERAQQMVDEWLASKKAAKPRAKASR